MKPITDEELQAMFDRCERASTGPWETELDEGNVDVCQKDWVFKVCRFIPEMVNIQNNAEFISHAREDVPRLVAEVKRLREGLQYLLRPYEAGRYLDWKRKQNEKDLTEFDWAHDVIRNILNGDSECTSV